MAHFAILCRWDAGHFFPMTAVGSALRARGHRVTLLSHKPAQASMARSLDLEWCPLEYYEPRLGRPAGWRSQAMWAIQRRFPQGRMPLWYTNLFLGAIPAALQERAIDGLLVDDSCPAGSTVAEHLGLPFVTIASLPTHWEPGVPPVFTHWPYADTPWARMRNRLGYGAWKFVYGPSFAMINRYRAAWNLTPLVHYNDTFSPLAQITQSVPEFDFPRRSCPEMLHYVGALSDGAARVDVDFPWERLSGRPLIYATLGTVAANRRLEMFRRIATACAGLDAQLVISLGKWMSDEGVMPEEMLGLSGDPVVVAFAPQCALIARAALIVNIAGMNTTMDALRAGVPLVVLPITSNQPGVATRLVRAGAGLAAPARRATIAWLHKAITEVLSDGRFRDQAVRLQQAMIAAGGAPRAAEIAERALLTRKPVRPDDVSSDQLRATSPRRAPETVP